MSVENTPVASVPVRTHSSTTQTRLVGYSLWLGRAVWTVSVVLTLVVLLAAIPARLNELRTVVPSIPVTNFWTGFLPPLTAEDADSLTQLGLSMEFYAVYAVAVGLAFAVGCLATGVILVWGRSRDWVALFVSLTFIICAAYFPPSIPFLLALQKEQPAFYLLVQFIIGSGFATTLTVWLIFPDGRFVPRWTRWFAAFWTAWMLAGVIVPAISPNRLSTPVFFMIFAVNGLIMIGSQVYRYHRVSNPVQRQQTKWLVLCFIIVNLSFIVGNIVVVIFPALDQSGVLNLLYRLVNALLFAIIFLIVPFGIILAVLRYRLWDVDVPINRSLVYGLLTIFLGGFFFVLFWVSQAVLHAVLGSEQNVVAGATAMAVTILSYNPTRKRIQNLIDRHVYGFRFDLNELGAAQKQLEISNPGVLTGKILDGYAVGDILGQGGMGEVYKGSGNGQIVAIKTMLPKIAADTSMRTRFQREAQAGMQLDHPHIAKVYTQGEVDGTPYLVMAYIEGQDLSRYIKSDGKLDEETAQQLMQDICAALDVAHSQGFIHRDLKPANIMITPGGQAILMDFGVTKVADATSSLTGTGAIGTIDYMAPEQIMTSKTVDKRADIYALGVMLYEMLTGEKPFNGSTAQILFAHLQQPPPDPRDINDGIPGEIATAIKKAMSKNPEERFHSAGEFAAALTA